MGFVPYPCQYCKYATLTKMGLCAREPWAHPPEGSQPKPIQACERWAHPPQKQKGSQCYTLYCLF